VGLGDKYQTGGSMLFKSSVLTVVLACISLQSLADSRHQKNYYNRDRNNPKSVQESRVQDASRDNSNVPDGQAEIIDLINRREETLYVEAQDMKIVKIMPDDRNGREHQIWITQLANGQYVSIIYNSDMCPRVNAQVGDLMSAGGNLVFDDRTKQPILHWVHYNPRPNNPSNNRNPRNSNAQKPHPDGYVEVDGQRYCFKKP
jgi:hypothetical protein